MSSGTYFYGSKHAVAEGKEIIVCVEGQDDAFFIDKLLEEIGADEKRVGIIYTGGIGEIPATLREITNSSAYVRGEIKRIAIIRDSDSDPKKAIVSIHKALSAAQMATPMHGAVAQYNGSREVALYVVPDGSSAGNLETLLLDANKDDPKLLDVTANFKAICAKYGALDRSEKRIAQMYMAVRPEECRGLGRAYKLGVFAESPAIKSIKGFLESVVQ